MKLLIVDDEPIIVRGLANLLDYQSLGYTQVLTAGSGYDALRLLRQHRPEAVISDIAMPDLNGLELLRLIREEQIATSVVFLSGYRSFDYAQEALQLGAKSYLLKPVEASALESELTRIGREHRARAEQNRLQKHMQALESEEQEHFPHTLPSDDRPFCLVCFHLALQEANSRLADGLKHFSAISKAEAYLAAQGCVAFPKGDYLCAVVYGEKEDCATRAARLASECSRMIEGAMACPFNHVTEGPLTSTRQIPAAFEACRARLNLPASAAPAEDSMIDRIKEYIAVHYGEDLTLEHMSETFAMNANYFSSFFHQKVGVRYKDYLTRVRMTEAKRLLLQTDLMVYEISQRVGFTDIRYFSQTFARHTGEKPKDYRKRR